MPTSARLSTGLAAALALIVSAGTFVCDVAPAAADSRPMALERAVGSWRGKGVAREASEETAEAVSCRSTNTFTEDALKISTTCKSASGEGELVAFIKTGAEAGTFGGVWYRNSTHLAAEERGNISGKQAGGDNFAMHVEAAGSTVAEVALSFSGATMHMTVSEPQSKGGGVLFDVAFNR